MMLIRELTLQSGLIMDDYIHQSNLIEGFDSIRADELLLKAWKRLLKIDKLDHHIIQLTQHTIVKHQDDLLAPERGHYRTMNVQVGGRLGAAPAMLESLMSNWLLDYPTASCMKHHINFEHIHPFADGNGRTGRLLMWWMQAKRGEQLTYISKAEVQKYYAWFR